MGEPIEVDVSGFKIWQVDFGNTNIGSELVVEAEKHLVIFHYECVSDECLYKGESFFNQVKDSLEI